MTKVQIRFQLRQPLSDAALARIADAHAIYGIYRVKLEPSLTELVVEYDATRLRPAEVERALERAGISVTVSPNSAAQK